MNLGRAGGQALIAAALVAGLIGLTGCATAPPPAGELLSGRLSVQVAGQPQRSVSAGFELIGTSREGRLVLSGPLGTTALRASWSPGRAVLADRDGETQFSDLDALATAALGEAIPMAALFDWLRGRPWPDAPARARADGQPGFEQLGWSIDLARWADGALEARRPAPPAITVRARLEPAQ